MPDNEKMLPHTGFLDMTTQLAAMKEVKEKTAGSHFVGDKIQGRICLSD